MFRPLILIAMLLAFGTAEGAGVVTMHVQDPQSGSVFDVSVAPGAPALVSLRDGEINYTLTPTVSEEDGSVAIDVQQIPVGEANKMHRGEEPSTNGNVFLSHVVAAIGESARVDGTELTVTSRLDDVTALRADIQRRRDTLMQSARSQGKDVVYLPAAASEHCTQSSHALSAIAAHSGN